MSEMARVVRPRNGGIGGPDRKMSGTRFKTYVQAAMREADDMSLAELARRSGVKERSWHDWFEGTHEPRPSSLARAGRALNRTPDQLLAAWDGQRPHKTRRATESPDALVGALLAQSAAIEALVEELRLEREEGRDVVTALDRAVVRLLEARQPPDNEGSAGRSALRETAE